MPTPIYNSDGTVSLKYAAQEIAQAKTANDATAQARADQIEADMARATMMTAARVAAVAPISGDDADEGSGS